MGMWIPQSPDLSTLLCDSNDATGGSFASIPGRQGELVATFPQVINISVNLHEIVYSTWIFCLQYYLILSLVILNHLHISTLGSPKVASKNMLKIYDQI